MKDEGLLMVRGARPFLAKPLPFAYNDPIIKLIESILFFKGRRGRPSRSEFFFRQNYPDVSGPDIAEFP